ncbi:MAG: FIST C-terminal domain-containing protein, partial [Proteobacteria bacterium]|nr:FIST C-terminal domain-containing protein [Pseudomonadota bacterium]
METRQYLLKDPLALDAQLAVIPITRATLVLVFAAPAFFAIPSFAQALATRFPGAVLLGCSTAGEISTSGVEDDSCVLTSICFEHTRVCPASTDLADMTDTRAAGQRLGEMLKGEQLRGIMVFGQGININGSALIDGMVDILGTEVPITGGLAGDGGLFAKTWTIGPQGVSDRAIVAIGLVGERLRFSHGCYGGWQPFGPVRKITRSVGNVLYDLDDEAALDIYKRYLGEYAKDLPSSSMLFPFAMLENDQSAVGLIRTILGIDEATGSLTMAGDINPDGYLKLMHASTDALVDGAEVAAQSIARVQ